MIKYRRIYGDPDGMRYELIEDYDCIVPVLRYKISLKAGMKSDGATFARDLGAKEKGWRGVWAYVVGKIMHSPKEAITDSWWGHDEICNTGMINGVRVSNLIASLCLSLLVWKDGYKVEAFTWFFATFFGGGGEAKKNGMFRVKNEVAH